MSVISIPDNVKKPKHISSIDLRPILALKLNSSANLAFSEAINQISRQKTRCSVINDWFSTGGIKLTT